MTVKKQYTVGDIVWVYGINVKNDKPIKGQVVKQFTIDFDGFNDEPHYVIAIPTEIEYLLEIRTWHNISQDEHGPVGSFRSLGEGASPTKKFMSKIGLTLPDEISDLDEPTAEEIHAAIEKSQKAITHSPLNLKETKPKKRFYNRKKKQ